MDQICISRPGDAPVLPDPHVRTRFLQPLSDHAGALGFDYGGVIHAPDVTDGYAILSSRELHAVTGNRVTLWNMEPWQDLSEPHERLRWARMRWQTSKGIRPDAGAAAESLGVQPHTYRAYERPADSAKHTGLSHQRAIQFARKFGVSWQWLLSGAGTPDDQTLAELTPIERRLINALREAPEARQTAVADAIEQLLKTG